MKTFVVRQGDQSWLTNAESPVEAVKYVLARNNVAAQPGAEYDVTDHDWERTIVRIVTTGTGGDTEKERAA